MEKMRICLSKVMYGILFLIVIPALLIIWARYTNDLIHLSVPANLFWGYLLLGTGLLLAVTGMFHLWIFGKGLPMNTFPPNTFIKKGIYAFTSHPIYIGAVLISFGISIIKQSASGFWLVSPLFTLMTIAYTVGFENERSIKKHILHKAILLILLLPVLLILIKSCEMPATSFDDQENANYFEKAKKVSVPQPDSTVKVMTWNIRFGIGRGPWFGDACGYKVIYSADEIMNNLKLIAGKINLVKPDILLLQEVDIKSTRSAYINELSWLLDNTYFNYAVYGSQWKAQFIPSDGLGRMDEGNAILSRWPLSEAVRIQLARRNDQGAAERYFYERCCMVEAKVKIPGFESFYVVNIHTSAFATDDTKHQHLIEFKEELDRLSASGTMFVAGGDLNTLPPESDSTDYCMEDMCPDESYHQPGDNPMHKDGSNYTPEKKWLVPLYSEFKSVIPLNEYLQNQQLYFTHTTRPEHLWDRTLDYLFTNNQWQTGTTIVHQDFTKESDHAPVSSKLIVIKK